VKRSTRVAFWLFERSRTARTVFILAVWPVQYAVDRLGWVDPSPLRWGLDWARDGAADVAWLRAATVAGVNQATEQAIAGHDATYHPGRRCRENDRGECADRQTTNP
jgi:hypothetical protein